MKFGAFSTHRVRYFLPTSLLLSCLLVYQPAVLMGYNLSAYYHRFFQLLPVLTILTLLLSSAVSFFCVKILNTPRREQAGRVVLNFLALSVWLGPVWAGLSGHSPFLNSSFGIALCLSILFAVTLICRNARFISQFLTFGMLVVMTHTAYLAVISYPMGYEFNVRKDSIATFSSQKNIIYILLDAFDSVNFQKTLESNPELLSDLDGFIFFKNTASGSMFTMDSIPSIQAGRYKFTEDSSIVYGNILTHDDSFLTALGRNGFETANYSWSVHFKYASTVDLPIKLVAGNPYFIELAQVLTLGLARAFGGVVGEYFNELNTRIYYEVKKHEALTYITNNLKCTNLRPVAKFFHLSPLHKPFTLDEDGKPRPFTMEGYGQEADELNLAATKHEMKNLATFLSALKKSDIYDKSMIVISGDHGYPQDDLVRRINPALLIKDYSAHGKLRISDVLASLIDVAPTILARNQVASDGQGFDLLAAQRVPPRVMPFFWFGNRNAYDIFYILDDFHNKDNWIPQAAVVDGFDLLGEFDDFYVKLINFGDVEAIDGWPTTYRWGMGPESAITFYDRKESWVKLDFAFDSPLYQKQEVDVLVNGTPVSRSSACDSLLVRTKPGLNRITFRFARYNHDGLDQPIDDSRNFAVRFYMLKAQHVEYSSLTQ